MPKNPDAAKVAPRKLIVFINLLEHASASIQFQLREKFADAAFAKENEGVGRGTKFSDRVVAALDNPAVEVLSGHFKVARLSSILRKHKLAKPVYFSFVRDPIERILAEHAYHAATATSPLHGVAVGSGIDGYLRARIDGEADFLALNQCAYLSGDGTPLFESALKSIGKNFAFVGLADDVTATNDQAKALLGIKFKATGKKTETVTATAQDIAPDLREVLAQKTAEDAKLYDHIRQSLGK